MADVGRPLKFGTVEELQSKIEDYFESCHNAEGECVRPLTITGLAVALDTSRRVLLAYEHERDEYSNTIKKAKQRIENFAEEALYTNKQTAGVIFNLKNNYGWVDKQEVDQTIGNRQGESFNVSNSMKELTVEELKKLAQSKPDGDYTA